MKLGAENTKKTIGAGALFLLAIVLFIRMLSGSSESNPTPGPAATAAPTPAPAQARRAPPRKGVRPKPEKASTPVTTALDPRLRLESLRESEETVYDGKGRNIFMATEEPKPVEIPKPVAPAIKAQATAPQAPTGPPPYVPPPINLKFFGFASGPDHKRVFLAQGDDVFVAGEGDIVRQRYKIVKINNNNIEVLDVLSNNHQTIPLTAG